MKLCPIPAWGEVKIFGILGKISTFAALTGRSTSKRYLSPL